MRLPLALSWAAAMNRETSSPDLWMSSSISITAWLAPPCSGPQSAHTPAAALANRLAWLDATRRAVGVQQEDQVQRPDHLRLQLVVLVDVREHHVQEVGRVLVLALGINGRQP